MAGSIVQIQTALGTGTGSSIAKAITVSAGNHVVAYVGSVFGTTLTASFSDSGSGTWNTTTTLTPSFGIRKCAYSENRSGTITVTATFGSADHRDRSLVLIEVSGLQTSGSLDQATGQDQGAATGTDSVTSTNPSSTTNANDFVLGITANSNLGANASAGTGFTAASGSPFAMDGNDVSVESKSVSSTGVYPALFTPNTNGSSWDTFVLIFKEATAAVAPPPQGPPPVVRPPPRYPRASDFTVPPAASVFTGTGFAPPERAVRPMRWLPPPRFDVLPPMAVAPVQPPPEALRSFQMRPRAAPAPNQQLAPFPGPVSVVGLRLWLRGDLGVTLSGPNVIAWADQSGNGNHTVNSGTVPFVASSINGKPGVTTTGAAGMVGSTDPLLAGSPRTIFVVSRSPTSAGGMALALRTSTVGNIYTLTGTGSGYGAGVAYYNNDVTGPMSITSPGDLTGRACICKWSVSGGGGAAPTFKLNGETPAVLGAGSHKTETGASGFGVGVTGVGPFNGLGSVGDICEVLVYDSVLSPSDEATVMGYLIGRYIPPAQPDAPMPPRRQLRPPAPTADALPPVAAPPPPAPPEAPRALPRRALAVAAYQPPALPPPPAAPPPPPPPTPLVVRAFRRVARWIAEVGWPAVVGPSPGPTLPPPFTTVVDPVVLSTWVDSVALTASVDVVRLSASVDSVVLTASVDPVRLSLGERLKPRKTTDTYPITNTLLSNGVAVNLTGYTVTINIVSQDRTVVKRANGACTITDAPNGKVSYTPVAGDVDTAGAYVVEWKAVSGGGTPYHFPQDGYEPLEIQPALG